MTGGGTGVGCLTLRLIGYKVGSILLRSRSCSTFGSWMVAVVDHAPFWQERALVALLKTL